ncbi:DUF1553 domain-containing protein [Termitidicoccus mucosus]|uniref:BIG2 domain-containing protein n=1 Tax=Termitidicoccus mucosus TaxID=1184151 RepID=A0A178IQU6_9BACT|nr:hypothetical protein AW736_01335 [Opitutaceae bacterium TSB47]
MNNGKNAARASRRFLYTLFIIHFLLSFDVIAEGALNVTPAKITAAPGEEIALKFNHAGAAKSAPGTHSSDTSVATIDSAGRVRAVSPGRALLSLRAGDEFVTIPVLVRRELPAGVVFPATDDSHPIDAAVNKNLRALGLVPSALCTDEEFLRRACIDLMGAPPPPDKAREFLADTSPAKRAALVDWIFTRPEYADYWAMKWGDVLRVKSEFPSNLWPNAVQSYHAWLRSAVAANMPYDRMTRALLLTSGSNFRDPPANFYRAMQKRSPENIASLAAVAFMGARLEFDAAPKYSYAAWTRGQSLGLASFFNTVKYKRTGEWKEEIVLFAPNWIQYKAPGTGEVVTPAFPDGQAVEQTARKNPLKLFADWLTAPENPWYARHAANRHWAALFGRGITSPVDDVRPSNPPSNPELLDLLAARLVETNYDLRDLLRFIVTSQTYQRSSLRNEWNRSDTQNWSHYRSRRLDAEVLADAIGGLTGAYESFSSRIPEPYAFWPDDFHAVQNPDASVTTGFLETFGRPARDSSFEYERNRHSSMAQALWLLDSDGLNNKIEKKDGGVRALYKKYNKDLPALADECYLALLSRHPTGAEKDTVSRYFENNKDKLKAAHDLVWALINTKEFLYNH